ncbi:MAG: diaminopropionate ammonia-lyase, partial [Betaproteobacteria bacterium]|nr:diaminopropionate ammonia-lyase [Betaproteobacteria bacterium]
MREVRMLLNRRAAARGQAYPMSAPLTAAGFAKAVREVRSWPGYAPTPLVVLPALADALGLAAIRYKDERGRFGLKSFKALGGAYAVRRVLARQNRPAAEVTVTCATDGNHGRSVAWGAQLFGCSCVIFVHATVSEGRAEAIRRYGAEVRRVKGNYDDAVRHAAGEAGRHGWYVVSDTSYEGYRDVPLDVMHGYGVMAEESMAQWPAGGAPTHIFVQAGVGALAAAICASFWLRWRKRRPRFVIVEPVRADCIYRSLEAGRPAAVHG